VVQKKLIFFTAQYPYGNKSETFIETEILYLSKAFDSIEIFPSELCDSIREVPSNVSVHNQLALLNYSKTSKYKSLFKNWKDAIEILYSEFQRLKLVSFFKYLKIILDTIAIQLIKFEYLNPTVSNKKNILLYDYWSLNSTLALALIKKKNPKIKFIARAHGYDLYEERNPNLGVLFRNFVIKYIDTQYLISDNGLDYQKDKIAPELHSKLKVSKLGVKAFIKRPEKQNDFYTIVSCSNILDFKGVHLIPQILKHIPDLRIKWIHFGDGPYLELLKHAITSLNSNIEVILKGRMDNQEVLQFYAENSVDLFISLSNSEGLPMSMMEAQSYGIPIIAYPVGGIPELVVDGHTGELLNRNHNFLQHAEIVKKHLLKPLDPNRIIAFWESNFNAEKNYKNFIENIEL
jgi:glycosyltransferase involved in cell wall biosynthesis